MDRRIFRRVTANAAIPANNSAPLEGSGTTLIFNVVGELVMVPLECVPLTTKVSS
jgi:hypothetical protein